MLKGEEIKWPSKQTSHLWKEWPLGLQAIHQHTQHLMWALGIWTQVFKLVQSALFSPSQPPSAILLNNNNNNKLQRKKTFRMGALLTDMCFEMALHLPVADSSSCLQLAGIGCNVCLFACIYLGYAPWLLLSYPTKYSMRTAWKHITQRLDQLH